MLFFYFIRVQIWSGRVHGWLKMKWKLEILSSKALEVGPSSVDWLIDWLIDWNNLVKSSALRCDPTNEKRVPLFTKKLRRRKWLTRTFLQFFLANNPSLPMTFYVFCIFTPVKFLRHWLDCHIRINRFTSRDFRFLQHLLHRLVCPFSVSKNYSYDMPPCYYSSNN